MSRTELTELDAAAFGFLDGTSLATKVGQTILLLTVGEDGFAHVAMLSVGELVAVGNRDLRLALWRGTETGRNLERTGAATFSLVHGPAAYAIEAEMELAGTLDHLGRPLDAFRGIVRRVMVDVADYATLTGGVTFDLTDESGVIDRWQRTVAALTGI